MHAYCLDKSVRYRHDLASSTRAGSAAATAKAMKSWKYADITTGVDFIRVAIETSGTWKSRPFTFSWQPAADAD